MEIIFDISIAKEKSHLMLADNDMGREVSSTKRVQDQIAYLIIVSGSMEMPLNDTENSVFKHSV